MTSLFRQFSEIYNLKHTRVGSSRMLKRSGNEVLATQCSSYLNGFLMRYV